MDDYSFADRVTSVEPRDGFLMLYVGKVARGFLDRVEYAARRTLPNGDILTFDVEALHANPEEPARFFYIPADLIPFIERKLSPEVRRG